MKFTTEHKDIIRKQWGGRLIKFLSKQLRHKLLYLGLPSPEIEDLHEWIEYLDKVIAFQCDDDRYPNAYEKLVNNLNELERQNKITTFEAYNGYIEEVVLQGYDNSASPQMFDLSEVITLYNLDFCNSIDSPIEIIDKAGNLKNVYKFDAVRKLLDFQSHLSSVSTRFILFLTVHCSYKGGELQNYIDGCGHVNYVKELYSKLDKPSINARIVRLFTVDTLANFLRTSGFIPKFFPTILYNGIGGTPLLHFTVMGTRNESAGIAPWHQTVTNLISDKFITIHEGFFANSTLDTFDEVNNPILDPVDFFARSQSFLRHWSKFKAVK